MSENNTEFSFENAMKRLEDIVNQMNDSSTSLETSLKYYEEAVQLTAQCEGRIREIENRVNEISKQTQNSITSCSDSDFSSEEQE